MSVIDEIAAERRRQVEQEGWTAEHDDDHENGEMAMAAALYAAPEPLLAVERGSGSFTFSDPWPWWDQMEGVRGGIHKVAAWDKRDQHDQRRRLIIAAALIVAEIERLDRSDSGTSKE